MKLDCEEIVYESPEINEEPITEKDILESLHHLGVKDPQSALSECKGLVDDKWYSPENRYILSREESIQVSTYTYEDMDYDTSPYSLINKKLWNNDFEDQIKHRKSYLRLLLRAIRKLPRVYGKTVYRGVVTNSTNCKVGDTIVWNGFSSTSLSMKSTQTFLKDNETDLVKGVLFEVHGGWGYSISNFSKYNERGNLYKQNIFFLHDRNNLLCTAQKYC